jgi:hypothetical protein
MTGSFAVKRRLPQPALMQTTDGGSDRVEHGNQFDPGATLEGRWGHWARKRSFPLLRA